MQKLDLFVEIDEYRMLSDKAKEKADNMLYNDCTLKEIKAYCINEYMKIYKNRLPELYRNCSFENFKTDSESQKKALEQAKNFVSLIKNKENKGKNLIILGNGHVGTGKTHLGCAIVNVLCDNGIGAFYIDSIGMFNSIRNTEDYRCDSYKNCNILFIDDIGKEKVTEWVCQTLYEIINARNQNGKTTILTTEKNIASLEEYYNFYNNSGSAIISRLTNNFEKITLDGEDYRHKR